MHYLELDFELIDDMIIGDFAGQEDSASTLSYITGSAIRGALIYHMIKAGQHSEEAIYKQVIAADVSFLNAYKIYEGKRSMPSPLCFATDKAKQRVQENSVVFNALSGEEVRSDEQRVRIKLGEFVGNHDSELFAVKVHKKDALHIKTKSRAKRESSKDSEMFRVEAIEKGQMFKSYIVAESNEALQMIQMSLEEGMDLYLGASRGNGYGHCKVTGVKKRDKNPEAQYTPTEQKAFYLLYMSDLILLDSMGQTAGVLSKEMMSNLLGVACNTPVIATETKIITGFNSKVGGRLPQYIGAKMGTVVKYSYEGQLDPQKVHAFADKSYGMRTQEGFGRIAVLSDFPYKTIAYNKIPVSSFDFGVKRVPTKEDQQVLMTISKSVYLTRLQLNIKKHIQKAGTLPLNKSKLAQWQAIFAQMKTTNYQEGIKSLESLKSHIEASISAEKNKKMKGFLEFKLNQDVTLYEFVLKSNTTACFNAMGILPIPLDLGGVVYKLKDEDIFWWNINYLEQLLYFKRVEEKGGM